MSLSFLSKKPWHVSTVRNVEKVWLAEKKRDEEAKRTAELQKQIDEEREIDDLRRLQRDQGLVTDPKQKVEWMYEGPGSAVSAAETADAYKLGQKAYEPATAATELAALESKEAAGSTWLDPKASDANEQFARLHNDPLYAMRQSEQRDRDKKVLKNPLAMRRIKQRLGDELREYEQRKRAQKEAKKARKEAKKMKKDKKKAAKKDKKKKNKALAKNDDDDSDDSDDDDEAAGDHHHNRHRRAISTEEDDDDDDEDDEDYSPPGLTARSYATSSTNARGLTRSVGRILGGGLSRLTSSVSHRINDIAGAKLTHDHATQFTYVRQSLLLWREVMRTTYKLWSDADADLLLSSHGAYQLWNTGQGLNRVQACPRVAQEMRRVLARAQRESGAPWVGLSVVHLGDRDVPNALMFIDKYTQVPRILAPVVSVVDAVPGLCAADDAVRAYVEDKWGGARQLQDAVLADFFKRAFDGDGDDGGSCIDGRLTSAWNWCSKIAKKDFYAVFSMAGFLGFDGSYRDD